MATKEQISVWLSDISRLWAQGEQKEALTLIDSLCQSNDNADDLLNAAINYNLSARRYPQANFYRRKKAGNTARTVILISSDPFVPKFYARTSLMAAQS